MGRSLAFIGFSSYSIYLWHIDLGGVAAKFVKPFLFIGHPELRWLSVTAIFAVAAVFGGMLIGRAIEMPILHLRDRLFPARASLTKLR